MINVKDIHSLTEFQRNARAFAQQVRETKRPLVLTVNGRAELVVQDAEAYQELLDTIEHLRTVEALKEGLEDARAGRTRPANEVLDELGEQYGLPD